MKKHNKSTLHDNIEQALAVLAKAGLEHVQYELRDGKNTYTSIGRALAYVEQSPLAIARLVHEHAEDTNHHDLAAFMRWLYPVELNPGNALYFEDVERIKDLLDREHVVLLSDDGAALGYSVRLVIDEVRVDMIASGYDWECPNCKHMNHEIEVTSEVKCPMCRVGYRPEPPEHAYS